MSLAVRYKNVPINIIMKLPLLLLCLFATTIISRIHAFGLPPLDWISPSAIDDFLFAAANINAESSVATAAAATAASAYSLGMLLPSNQGKNSNVTSSAAASPSLSFLDLWKSSQRLGLNGDDVRTTTSWIDMFANNNATTISITTASVLDMEGNPVSPLSDKIALTASELDLFRLISDVRQRYSPSTTVRIAGGWVRDKLLQRRRPDRQCVLDDIDFVLSDCSGRDFARYVDEYVKEQQQDDIINSKYPNIVFDDASSSSKPSQQFTSDGTTANRKLKDYKDTQSEHLQTASLRLGPYSLDFGQMRFEKYNKDSRVPTQTFTARAVQDAFRRDLTINALYYNLNTNRVEDWTERGLEDLYFRNLATPTPARKALLEDPLRMLRAIRFAAQLSFAVDPALLKAGSDPQTRTALVQKVSSVRIGNEVDGIFKSADPTRGVGLLLVTKLIEALFALKDPRLHASSDADGASDTFYQEGYQLLFRTQTLVSRIFQYGKRWDEERRRYLWYAAFLKPIYDSNSSNTSSSGDKNRQWQRRNKQQRRSLGKRERREESIVYLLLAKQLARPTRDVESVESILEGSRVWQVMLRNRQNDKIIRNLLQTTPPRSLLDDANKDHDTSLEGDEELSDLRLASYKLLKRIGPLWQESLFLALALSTDIPLAEAVRLALRVINMLEGRLGLDASVVFGGHNLAATPLLNGGEIRQHALPNLHGEAFRKIMQAQEDWQIRHCWSCSPMVEEQQEMQRRQGQKDALIDYLKQSFPQYC